ncbi:MAG: hypothetical protein COU47_01845 [Candidatus Niyogibacteria bacterium CG10_big_fil_rev_8_21_14_0_10_46_36]|uniref:Endonuclease GajA/Old nuclease/RecF-like AAA domain-containing protein n=1 Tax=Candidatus Niyogibacteria bacterium CG10_big_fil_rev_8_21_14_0_10_46_36 TaxID=1974726 RepID=A0A2H0TDJ0_9BACT|nr:MAG: hypothetical protein COU47_01845 [Candidatus Niyogibacteria bacterium CG10_big_fil_rev_8_21_14_0_10_46_36]
MKIKTVSVKNFRGIGGDEPTSFECENFNLFIGDNGTSKTAILEAINLCLSSSYAASRLSIKDFYLGSDKPIEIKTFFEEPFNVSIPDLYGNAQTIQCNGIALTAKKRDRSAPGKAFNDLVVAEHHYLPIEEKGEEGWSITRKSGSELKVTARHLALSYASSEVPKAFYFGRDRGKHLQKRFKTSISNIIDDLNWRFEKNERVKEDAEKFKHKRADLEKHVYDNTGGDTLKSTIEETNKTLKRLDIPPIDLSLIKTLTPYDTAEVVKRFDGFELPIQLAGSGIEMITALVFLETLARISKSEICIIIDEPELHLHPTLQDKIAHHLEHISKTSQVFASTHSPFFFKNCFERSGIKVLLAEINDDKVRVRDAKDKWFGLLQWSPSWGEICYFAYNLPTNEFHDDLYASLQDKIGFERVCDIEAWFTSNGQSKEIKWTDANGNIQEETLMTYIRNRIHHGDNQNRPLFTPKQLADSIKRMISLLR